MNSEYRNINTIINNDKINYNFHNNPNNGNSYNNNNNNKVVYVP
jgi:hypothetical protein